MKLNKNQIENILNNWNLGKLKTFKKAIKGVVNHNWIIKTTKGKFILRGVVFHKKLKDLKFELKYTDYLKRKKFPYKVPSPITNKKGKFLFKFGKNYFWIYNYIKGRDIKRFNKRHLNEIAKMMGKYHHLIEKSKLNNGRGKGNPFVKNIILKELNGYKSMILKKRKIDKKDKVFLNELLKVYPLLKGIKTKEYSKLKRYPIHRDINPENTIWNKGKLIGVIDFETASEINEPLVKNLVVMIQYSCRIGKNKIDLNLFNYFIKKYKKHHSLSNKEIKFIPDIITAGAIEDFTYQYWMFMNDPTRVKLYRLNLYSKMAQWSNKNKEKIIKRLR